MGERILTEKNELSIARIHLKVKKKVKRTPLFLICASSAVYSGSESAHMCPTAVMHQAISPKLS